MKVELGKQYRTRDGDTVRLFVITDAPCDQPVFGAIEHEDGQWESATWNLDGSYFETQCFDRQPESGNDLVELKPEHTVWVNIYRHGENFQCGGLAMSRESAEARKDPDRIGCLKLTFREGDGL